MFFVFLQLYSALGSAMPNGFLGVELDPSLKFEISRECELFKKINGFEKQREENLHLTIYYLDQFDLTKLEKIFHSSSIETCPKDLVTRGIRILFENQKYYLVLDVTSDSFLIWRDKLYQKLTEIGFRKDSVPFSPHITLGFIRDEKKTLDSLNDLIKKKQADLSWKTISPQYITVFETKKTKNFKTFVPIRGCLVNPLAA